MEPTTPVRVPSRAAAHRTHHEAAVLVADPPGDPETAADRPTDPPTDPRRRLGAYGEELAARYLSELGWRIIARNWRCEHGEVDIVARDGGDLVVVEVKTRSGVRFGEPVDAVGWAKALRLRRLALAAARELEPERCGLRVDVIGVLRPPTGPAQVRHIRGLGS